jgi:hypothetical protein
MQASWRISIGLTALTLVWSGCRLLPSAPTAGTTAEQLHGQLVIHSDSDLPHLDRVIQEIVAERNEVCDRLALPPSDEPIHVHLHRDPDRFREFRTRRYPVMPDRRAFFVETDTQLVVHAQWSDRIAEDLRHEVAHGYLHSMVGNLPLWLDEGLAEYFEVPRGREGINQPHVELLADLLNRKCWQPDLGRLESQDDFATFSLLDYAEAWAWVHFLLKTEPARQELLHAYLAELRTKGAAEPLARQLAKLHYRPEENLREHILELHAASVAGNQLAHHHSVGER